MKRPAATNDRELQASMLDDIGVRLEALAALKRKAPAESPTRCPRCGREKEVARLAPCPECVQ